MYRASFLCVILGLGLIIFRNSASFGDQVDTAIKKKVSNLESKLSKEDQAFVVLSFKNFPNKDGTSPTLSVKVQTDGHIVTENGVQASPPSRLGTATGVASKNTVSDPTHTIQSASQIAQSPIMVHEIISSIGAAVQAGRAKDTIEADSKAYFSDHPGAAGRMYEIKVEHSFPNEAGIDAQLVTVFPIDGGGTKDDEIYTWANRGSVRSPDDKFSLIYVDSSGTEHPVKSGDVVNVYDDMKSPDYAQEMDRRIQGDHEYEKKSGSVDTEIQQAHDKNDGAREATLQAQRQSLDEERANELKEERQRDNDMDRMRELEDKSRDGPISRDEQQELNNDVDKAQASQNVALPVNPDAGGPEPIQCNECARANFDTLRNDQFLGNYEFISQKRSNATATNDVKIYVSGTNDSIATVRNFEGLSAIANRIGVANR